MLLLLLCWDPPWQIYKHISNFPQQEYAEKSGSRAEQVVRATAGAPV